MIDRFPEAFAAAAAHARAEYPKESCGLIVAGVYQPAANLADDPMNDFVLDPAVINPLLFAGAMRTVDAIVHSHPGGPHWPSKADMEGQIQTDLPWAIIPLDEDRTYKPLVWGASTPIPPMIGREFVHGVTDCYSLIRDCFRLGADALAAQGVTNAWPFIPIELEEIPREDSWWAGDADLYSGNFARMGFVVVKMPDVRPGDVFLTKIRSEKFNHGGLLVGNDLILHHLPARLSRREPAGLWGRQAGLWIRYEGPTDA
ncbi:Mov34/MPN/PAD-1 family protein [Ancylobacter rudongensis]|uniref:Proteasome lid subunit RPN8/RPN11, contains Jab1/MPN metalloenzyme (JAMM) motif n=1 Tax=Ancylobacter rudongensis TaxID=177413 RepID=A0A1G4US98_9HYPH|nr:Mov34/MPN/PAD-1 family protein [Ancylobacter rudongensis]SCW95669.1 Proteasome lid subunit RPN8/RPN11, contains Jab1/MPN metalloenzyme (JAMM) motif [Ancylobacter rudongensis]